MSDQQMVVALLRAVNLGQRNKVPQKPLAEAVSNALGVPVRHHLQSGNLIVPGDAEAVGAEVARLIKVQTDLDIPVITRSAAQFRQLLSSCPWPDDDPTRVHLALWSEPHSGEAQSQIEQADWAGDQIEFVEHGAWMSYATSFHQAKLGNHVLERKLKVTGTARNRKTIEALVAML